LSHFPGHQILDFDGGAGITHFGSTEGFWQFHGQIARLQTWDRPSRDAISPKKSAFISNTNTVGPVTTIHHFFLVIPF